MEIIVGSFMTIAVFNIIFYFYFQRRVVFLFLFLYCTINIFKINLVQSVIYGEATPSPGGVGHFNGVGVVVRAVG